MANKVAACIITGDTYEDEEVKKLLKSLEPHVDAVFVNYNGKKGKLPWQKWTTLPVTYKKFKWEDDFALARNQSFSLVPQDEFDWMMWIDTDDILVGEPGAMDKLLDSLDEYSLGVFLKYEYAVDPETGAVVVEQWRERILSTKMTWNWVFPIHEVCRSISHIQYAKREELHIRHQRNSGESHGARNRNKKIIMKAAQEHPEEPRYQFYLASETLAEADGETDPQRKALLIDAAIVAFETYRGMVHDLTDDVYLATARMADLYRMKGDHAGALEADLECIAIYPEWPDGYVGAAKSCMELGDWNRMKAFASMAVKCPKPTTAASIEPQLSGFTPMLLRAMANDELGDMENALKDYKAARKIWRPSGESGDTLDEKIKTLENFDKTKDKTDAWTARKKLRGTKQDKSIAFYTQPIPEVWNPDTFKSGGHGGAETCIIKLAPMFAADGWRVVVFGTPGDYRGVDRDGIEWWGSEEYLPGEKFHTFVSSRSVVPFDGTPLAKVKLLWMHDVNIGPEEHSVLMRPDKVLGLTNWHANHLAGLYGLPSEKLAVMPNGIDLSRFDRNDWDKTDKYNFIYSSSPDRGLETMLSLWPLIKELYPEAKLNIFYGWDLIDKIVQMYKARNQASHLAEQKARCLAQIDALGGEEGGIIQHGRVDQKTLAKEMAKCSIWTHPTDFMETFCITALEMQMSGVIPLTSSLAALNETVNPNVPKVTGWPRNSSYQKEFLKLLSAMLVQEEWQESVREENREFASLFSWESVYGMWNDLIKEVETGETTKVLINS